MESKVGLGRMSEKSQEAVYKNSLAILVGITEALLCIINKLSFITSAWLKLSLLLLHLS